MAHCRDYAVWDSAFRHCDPVARAADLQPSDAATSRADLPPSESPRPRLTVRSNRADLDAPAARGSDRPHTLDQRAEHWFSTIYRAECRSRAAMIVMQEQDELPSATDL